MDTCFECPWFKSWEASAAAFFFWQPSRETAGSARPVHRHRHRHRHRRGGGLEGGAPPLTISTPAARSARHTVNTADRLQHADSVCNWQTGPPPGRRGGALGGISPQRWPAEGRVSSPWAEEKIRRGRPVRVVAGQPATFGHERQICADFCCSMIQLRDFAISDSGALLEHALLHRGPTPLNTRATRLHMLFHPRSQ